MEALTTIPKETSKSFDIFNKPTSWYLHIGAFFIGGFIGGLLLKYFGRYVVLLVLIGAVTLWGLELLHVININYSALKDLLGLAPDAAWTQLFAEKIEWIRNHSAETIAAGIGMVIAWITM